VADPLGLESGAVHLAEYDPRWSMLFVAEQAQLRAACGSLPLRFEHIGGTSIPGMCAKPVLDILAGRPPEITARDCVPALTRCGYDHRGEQGVPGREFFRRGMPRAYHVHLVEAGGRLWREYLAFRDYLRSHPDAARQFGDLKRTLAARFPRDREAYTNGKTASVREILQLASGQRSWRDP
jgi:GrpB-like predicted nucleotidyltransferase (UPF0157 family)